MEKTLFDLVSTLTLTYTHALAGTNVHTQYWASSHTHAKYKVPLMVKCEELSSAHSPHGFEFVRRDDNVIYYNSNLDETTSIPAIHECIQIDHKLHVVL